MPPFDFHVPGVTSMSADTHKYGYGLKGTRRCCSPTRNCARRSTSTADWSRRHVHVAGHGGEPLRWRDRQHLGGDGVTSAGRVTARTPRTSSRPPPKMDDVSPHPELRIMEAYYPRQFCPLHLRRLRHLPRQRLPGPGAGASTASSTPTPSTSPSPARRPKPASSRSSSPTSPRRSSTPRRSRPRARRRSRARSTAAGRRARPGEADDFIVAVMDDMLDNQQVPASRHDATRRPRARRRPRHGRAQGRLRHACAADRWWSTPRCRRTWRPAASGRRTPRSGGGSSSRRRTPRRGVRRPSRVVAVSVTGQWASTVPVDEQGVPVGPCVLWSDTRGAPYSRAASADRSPATRPGRWPPGCAAAAASRRSGADPVGHILFLQHDEPDLRPRPGGCSSRSTTCRCGSPAACGRHASMTGAWLTDNRSLATLAYDDVLVALPGWTPRAAAARGYRVGRRRRCRPRWPTSSASRPRPSSSPACPTCTRPPSARARSATGRAARRRSARPPGSAPGAAQEERPAPDRPRCPASTTRRTSSPTTTRPPAATCSGCATRRARRRRTTSCWPRPGARRRGPAASCSRRGSRASGRRSTTATPAPASTTSARPPPAGT